MQLRKRGVPLYRNTARTILEEKGRFVGRDDRDLAAQMDCQALACLARRERVDRLHRREFMLGGPCENPARDQKQHHVDSTHPQPFHHELTGVTIHRLILQRLQPAWSG